MFCLLSERKKMKEPFFEEYELKVVARIAAPSLSNTNLSKDLYENVLDALTKRRDILVGVTSLTIEPVTERKKQ